MNPIVLIKVFYKNDAGDLIAVIRQNRRAKWYRYSYGRSARLGILCMNSQWTIRQMDINNSHYVIVLRKEN